MAIAADRPGAAPAPRAVTLRIKRGAKVLSDVRIGRARVVVGSGKKAQLRLKNAGLAEECLVLDTRAEPYGIESRLGPDDIRVNGRPILSSLVRIGDVIELAGLTLELVDPDGAASARRPAPADAPSRPLADEAIDPYMGKATAAKVKQADVDRARQLLERREARGRNGSGDGRLNGNGAAAHTAEPVRVSPPPAVPARAPSARPPWIELVGDGAIAEARLYLQDGTVAGRQGDARVRHPSVSKRHARFSIEAGHLLVEDLGSTNGVWVNRERITQKRALSDGDTLHLGAVEFAVRIPSAGREEEVTTLGVPGEEPAPAARLEGAEDFRERATERENGATRAEAARSAFRERPTEQDVVPPGRSPFLDDEDEHAPTGTGAPGRSDKTDREIEGSRNLSPIGRKPSASAPLPPPEPRRPTASALFGDVEDLSEKLGSGLEAPTLDREPRGQVAKTRVRAPEPAAVEPVFEDASVPRGRRSIRKMIAVASMALLLTGAVVGALAVWPRVAPLVGIRTGPVEAGGAPGKAEAAPTVRPEDGSGKKVGPAGRKVAGPGGAGAGSPGVATTEPDLTSEGPGAGVPVSLFEDEPLDLRSDSRLDKELASLERDSAEKGLRAERTIGQDQLKSIFLAEANAVVRRYRDDGFTQAPSAADDPADAEARRQGAQQIDPDTVNRLIRDRFPAVKRCLVGSSVKRGKARVVVEFTIQPSGKVESASVVDSDISGSPFKSCVAGVVRGIRFPKPKDQSVVVQFPFVFTYN